MRQTKGEVSFLGADPAALCRVTPTSQPLGLSQRREDAYNQPTAAPIALRVPHRE